MSSDGADDLILPDWSRTGADQVRSTVINTIAVNQAGEPHGTPLLFLHGIGSAGLAFDAQLARFSPIRWCLAPDAPGYGGSADDPSIASLDDYADRWAAMLDALDVEQADVLGVSWGGVQATRLAARHPERVRRLILADSSRGSNTHPDKAAAMRSRFDDVQREGVEAYARSRAPRLLAESTPDELRRQVAGLMAWSVRPAGYAQAVESMASTDNSDCLRVIDVPALVIYGAEDRITPPEESAVLADLLPNSRLVEIPAAGHLANQEQPDAFNDAVESFLSV